MFPLDSMGVGGSGDLSGCSDWAASARHRRRGIVAGHPRRTHAPIGHGEGCDGPEPECDVLAADEYVDTLFLHADRITHSLLARIGFHSPVDRYTGRLAPVGAFVSADPEREQGQEPQWCVLAPSAGAHASSMIGVPDRSGDAEVAQLPPVFSWFLKSASSMHDDFPFLDRCTEFRFPTLLLVRPPHGPYYLYCPLYD